MCLFEIAAAVQLQGNVVHVDRLPGPYLIEQRLEISPGLGPNLPRWSPETVGMLASCNRDKGIIREPSLIRSPGDKHRLSGIQHQLDQRSQRHGPSFDWTERCVRPSMGCNSCSGYPRRCPSAPDVGTASIGHEIPPSCFSGVRNCQAPEMFPTRRASATPPGIELLVRAELGRASMARSACAPLTPISRAF
jgi:hypothetical protein